MTNLVDRTREFSLRVIRLVSALPDTRIGWRLGDQLLRSGTSPGAHFREALRARSKAEYVAKPLYWLELIEGANLMTSKKLESIRTETNDLIAIFVSLIKKWRGK
ncbi:MAG TPA: four helix bundle protein [Thermoanaerobaculia bacterium]|nr:four helix bundle protein [Thermoanaerobaculia bacterium]